MDNIKETEQKGVKVCCQNNYLTCRKTLEQKKMLPFMPLP